MANNEYANIARKLSILKDRLNYLDHLIKNTKDEIEFYETLKHE